MSSTGPSSSYWLVFAALGAVLSFAATTSVDTGGHGGSSAALGMWLVSAMVSAGSIAGGAILAIFPKTHDIGIAFVAAGLGGLIMTGLFAG
jgi:hypothetical protein